MAVQKHKKVKGCLGQRNERTSK